MRFRMRLAVPSVLLPCLVVLASFCSLVWCSSAGADTTRAQQRRFNRSIVDYTKHQNSRFKKVRRKSTRYLIVHTAEAGLRNTLRVVSEGKRMRGGRRTYGGHTHYVIGRDGKTYRILNKKYRADHAGRSMWNGRRNISDISIGIELVGYHHSTITVAQYHSLEFLVDILQRIYKIGDRSVLTHSQVAYGPPNPWFRRDHRGRKHCAQNFDRFAAGVGRGWTYDPDVRAGRLLPDRELALILYSKKRSKPAGRSQVITSSRSAWMIAGEKYNASTTTYRLPSGRVYTGNLMNRKVGWSRVPPGTVVTVGVRPEKPRNNGDADYIVRSGDTPWSLAGSDYKRSTTHYFYPNGVLKNGQQISDWASIPNHTRIFVGYQGPYRVTASRPPIVIAGQKYRDENTLYLFPDRRVLSGAEIKNFKRLPRGVRILLPLKKTVG